MSIPCSLAYRSNSTPNGAGEVKREFETGQADANINTRLLAQILISPGAIEAADLAHPDLSVLVAAFLQDVMEALADNPWPTREERVWVNPPFYRFLGGDYK